MIEATDKAKTIRKQKVNDIDLLDDKE